MDHLLSGVLSSTSVETIPVNLEGNDRAVRRAVLVIGYTHKDFKQTFGFAAGLLFGLERPISPTGQ